MIDDTLMLVIFSISGLIALNALSYYSKRWAILPEIIWVLLIGVAYSFVAEFTSWGLPAISLQPTVVLYIFVPLLVFASAQKMCLFHFRRVLVPSSLIGSVGILVSLMIIGFVLHYGFGIPLLPALLFGTIISATDTLAIGALLSETSGIKDDHKQLIEGEAILNDGFVVAVFGILTLIIYDGGDFSLLDSGMTLVLHIAGALLVGVILGRAARWLLGFWHGEHFTLTTNITLALAYSSYITAEILHFSGILCVVVAALAYGYRPTKKSGDKRALKNLWDYFEYLANAVLFFILGASVFTMFSLETVSIMLVVAAIGLLFLSRFFALFVLYPLIRIKGEKLSKKGFWMLNFSGARGAVSVTLILLLPDDFALKPLFLSLAFIMIFFSLLIYPLAMRKIALMKDNERADHDVKV